MSAPRRALTPGRYAGPRRAAADEAVRHRPSVGTGVRRIALLLVGVLAISITSSAATPMVAASVGATRQRAYSTSESPVPPVSAPDAVDIADQAEPDPLADTRSGEELATPFAVNGVMIVSAKHPVSKAYVPSLTTSKGATLDPEALRAYVTMVAAAKSAGVTLLAKSSYRSFASQMSIWNTRRSAYSSEAAEERYIARPGESEHQTGLSVDVWDGVHWGSSLATTKLGAWMAANGWKYGWVQRYPDGKEAITGHATEEWHFRYVGVEAAKAFAANKTLTLEEYLGLA